MHTGTCCPCKYKEADCDQWAGVEAGEKVVLELAKCAVRETGKNAVLEVQHLSCKCEQAGWEDNEEDQASGLGVEIVVDGVDERE